MASRPDAGGWCVLRARIGIHLADPAQRAVLQDRLAAALIHELHRAQATIERLQIGVAIDPRWHTTGPPNRVTDGPRCYKDV